MSSMVWVFQFFCAIECFDQKGISHIASSKRLYSNCIQLQSSMSMKQRSATWYSLIRSLHNAFSIFSALIFYLCAIAALHCSSNLLRVWAKEHAEASRFLLVQVVLIVIEVKWDGNVQLTRGICIDFIIWEMAKILTYMVDRGRVSRMAERNSHLLLRKWSRQPS